uniref:Uncharacterized protein n=1 Tax=Anguilla anguilla TaxID=7936 RepID=A0A0E9SYP9_ANGAN
MQNVKGISIIYYCWLFFKLAVPVTGAISSLTV